MVGRKLFYIFTIESHMINLILADIELSLTFSYISCLRFTFIIIKDETQCSVLKVTGNQYSYEASVMMLQHHE